MKILRTFAGSESFISPALQRVVSRCLEKDVHDRFQTARDLVFALETITDLETGVHSSGRGRGRSVCPRNH